MLRTAGRFAWGAFVELLQLTLVLVAALFAIEIAIGHGLRDAIASDVPEPPNQASLVLLVLYALLVWWPARDLVEGWLGMVSRRLPDRYDDRAENLGRGVLAVVFAVFWTILWFVADADASTAQGEAFDRSYALFALAIFGIGGAIPRLWFGRRHAAWGRRSDIPELLAQAGKRGAIFIILLFVGIALGFVAAYAVEARRPDYRRPTLSTSTPLPVEDQRWGTLCRQPTNDCPSSRHITAPRMQRAKPDAVHVEVIENGEPPVCDVVPVWTVDDRYRRGHDRTVPVSAGATIAFDVALPERIDRCSYFVDVTPAKPSP